MEKMFEVFASLEKAKLELENKEAVLMKEKDRYATEIVNDAANQMTSLLEVQGTMSERDFQLFLGELATNIKLLYTR